MGTVPDEQKIEHYNTLAIILAETNIKFNYTFILRILDEIEIVRMKLHFDRQIPKVEFLGNF